MSCPYEDDPDIDYVQIECENDPQSQGFNLDPGMLVFVLFNTIQKIRTDREYLSNLTELTMHIQSGYEGEALNLAQRILELRPNIAKFSYLFMYDGNLPTIPNNVTSLVSRTGVTDLDLVLSSGAQGETVDHFVDLFAYMTRPECRLERLHLSLYEDLYPSRDDPDKLTSIYRNAFRCKSLLLFDFTEGDDMLGCMIGCELFSGLKYYLNNRRNVILLMAWMRCERIPHRKQLFLPERALSILTDMIVKKHHTFHVDQAYNALWPLLNDD
jgi:hypothetical protein